MSEGPNEIVLVGYDNGTVKLLSKSNKSIIAEGSEVIELPPETIAAYKKYANARPFIKTSTPIFDNNKNVRVLKTKNGKPKPGRKPLEPTFMQCDLCPYNTMKRRLIIQHMSVSHMSQDRECQICGKRLNKMQLKLHMRFHDLKFVCDMCGKRFGDSKALRNHRNSRVCGEKYIEGLKTKHFKCNYCDYRTHTHKLLMVHFRTMHVPKDQICPHCNKAMTTKQLQSHLNNCNRGTFNCQLCSKRFSNPKYLNSHIRKKHMVKEEVADGDYVIAELTANDEEELNDSQYAVHEEIDWKAFIQKIDDQTQLEPHTVEYQLKNDFDDDLEMPVEALAEEFPEEEEEEDTQMEYEVFVECPEEEYEPIEEKFIKQEFEEPQLCHFVDNLSYEWIDEKPAIIKQDKDCYMCDICYFQTPVKHFIEQHIIQMHLSRDIVCPECGKLCTEASYYRHVRRHNKKHMCEKCGKRFPDPGSLRQHVLKQRCNELTLEDMLNDPTYMAKPYACDACLYRGETEKNLKRHIRYMHRDIPKDKTCPDCGKQMNINQLRSHRKAHIKKQCHICFKWLTDSKFFKVHVANHNKPKEDHQKTFPYPEPDPRTGIYKCTELNCTYETPTRRFVAQHWQHIHAPKDRTCPYPECSGKMMSDRQLKHHMRGHNRKFRCDICDVGYPDRRDLQRHKSRKRCKPPKNKEDSESDDSDMNSTIDDFFSSKPDISMESPSKIINIKNEVEEEKNETQFETQGETPIQSIDLKDDKIENPALCVTPNAAGIYECPNCNYESTKKRLLSQHWLHLHGPKNKPCPFPECNGKLLTTLQYKIHMKLHETANESSKLSQSKKANSLKIQQQSGLNEDLIDKKLIIKLDKIDVSSLKRCVKKEVKRKESKKLLSSPKKAEFLNKCKVCQKEFRTLFALKKHSCRKKV